MGTSFKSYSQYIRDTFGERVQKISIDAGFTCPNLDGTKGKGGCIYCNNTTFKPFYTSPEKSITQQLNEGIAFFEPKYKTQKYLAYFQSYTNTYADVSYLKKMYDEALSHSKVIGIVISTRPDCINEEIVNLIQSYTSKYYVAVELGIESTKNQTLLRINRCHTFQDTIKAYRLLENKAIHLGAHLILGLPGEDAKDFKQHAQNISQLPIEFLKLHHLQIIKGTRLAIDYNKDKEHYHLFTVDEYIDTVISFLENLSPHIIIERFISEAPSHLLIAPQWGGIKNFEITERIKKKLQ